MDKSNTSDVLIVGAGPGGLAASLLLAHSGLKVTIIEKSSAVGGRTKLMHKDGFTFSENNNDWHHSILTKELYDKALSEL